MIPNLMVVSIFFNWVGEKPTNRRHERLEFYIKNGSMIFFLSKVKRDDVQVWSHNFFRNCGWFFKMCKSSFTASSVPLGFLCFFVGGSLKKYMLVCFLNFQVGGFRFEAVFCYTCNSKANQFFYGWLSIGWSSLNLYIAPMLGMNQTSIHPFHE